MEERKPPKITCDEGVKVWKTYKIKFLALEEEMNIYRQLKIYGK